MTRLHLFVSIFLAALLTATSVLATSDPIPGVDIIVKKNPGSIVQHVTTDDNGNFHLNKLPEGSYTLEVSNTAKLTGPVKFNIAIKSSKGFPKHLVSARILPTKLPGSAPVLGRTGGVLIIPIPKGGAQLSAMMSIFDRWGNLVSRTAPDFGLGSSTGGNGNYSGGNENSGGAAGDAGKP